MENNGAQPLDSFKCRIAVDLSIITNTHSGTDRPLARSQAFSAHVARVPDTVLYLTNTGFKKKLVC